MSSNEPVVTNYHISMRIIHWLMALIIIGLIILGIYMEDLPKEAPNRAMLYSLHKSFGVVAILLLIARVVSRLATKIPPLPSSISKAERILAHIVHISLYITMFAVAFSGYIMSDAIGYGVKLFGIDMPDFFATDKEFAHFMHSIHGTAPYIMIGLLLLHIAGVIKHRFVDKGKNNDVLPRMLFSSNLTGGGNSDVEKN